MNDFNDLKKWQATSHPDLAETQAEVLFNEEFAAEYRKLHADIRQRMINLHATIHTLETLEEFPLIEVFGPEIFWQLVMNNFWEISVVKLHSLVNDNGDEAITLPKLKNRCMTANWKNDELKKKFQVILWESKFEKLHDEIITKLSNIRNNYVAHSLEPKKETENVSISDIRTLYDRTHDLFGAISFGTTQVTLPGDYMPTTIGGKPTKSSLDDILDSLLRDNDFINQPERDQWWLDTRSHMSESELNLMSNLRKRIGLPAV